MIVRELSNTPPDLVETFSAIIERFQFPLLLDSEKAAHETTRDIARYSFAMGDPQLLLRAWGRQIEITDRQAGTIVRKEGRALDYVRSWLPSQIHVSSANEQSAPLPPFRGGATGYVGYEYGGVLEHLPRPSLDDLELPDVVIGKYNWVIAWDHLQDITWLFAETPHALEQAESVLRYTPNPSASQTAEQLSNQSPNQSPNQFQSTFDQQSYETAIERIREYIRAGDIFQANLSQRCAIPCATSPWALYQQLRSINPAPFSAYFDIGDMTIVSASPERFLQLSETGHVETRPIKGTRPRGGTAQEDAQRCTELLQSEKDAAEHVMIVDVLRNDISRVCEYGSVHVPTLKALESHPTVHHLVSTVTGQLRPSATAIDLVHACFPGGSITGAPKVRAMEIIAELEPTVRNVYCGSILYLSTTGAMDSSIVIRTVIIKDAMAYFSVGGGIVADSVPADEYEETLDKARALIHAIQISQPLQALQ